MSLIVTLDLASMELSGVAITDECSVCHERRPIEELDLCTICNEFTCQKHEAACQCTRRTVAGVVLFALQNSPR